MPGWIAVIISIAFLVLLVPNQVIPVRSNRLQRELNKLGSRPSAETRQAQTKSLRAFRMAARLPLGPLPKVVGRIVGARGRSRFDRWVLHGRLEEHLRWEEFLALKVAIPLIGFLYVGVIYMGSGWDTALAVVMLIPVLGFYVPDQWLHGRMKRRQAAIERELPAVLSALAITTEAGLGLLSAIEEIARSHKGVLGSEFRWAHEQVQLGLPQGQALETMASRSGVQDLTLFVSTLVQSFEKGSGRISETLRDQAHDAWAKRRRRAEELAQTASTRLFLPLVLLVFPAMLIFLLGPALITISDFFGSTTP